MFKIPGKYVDLIGGSLLVALVVAVGIFLIAPIAVTTILSFDARSYLGPFPPPDFSLHWYADLLRDRYVLDGLKTSAIVGLLASSTATIAGASAAVMLHFDDSRFKNTMLNIFLSPLMVPGVVIGFAILFAAAIVGIIDGFPRLLAGHIVLTIPYTIRATLAALVGVRRSLYDSALVLGAKEIRALFDVILPQAKTGIVAGFIVSLAVSFDDVAISIFLVSPDAYTLPVALASMMKGNFDLSVAAASVLLLLVTIAMLVAVDRFFGLDRLLGWHRRSR